MCRRTLIANGRDWWYRHDITRNPTVGGGMAVEAAGRQSLSSLGAGVVGVSAEQKRSAPVVVMVVVVDRARHIPGEHATYPDPLFRLGRCGAEPNTLPIQLFDTFHM